MINIYQLGNNPSRKWSENTGIMSAADLFRDKPFRYEKKYVIDNIQAEELRERLMTVCELDSHVENSFQYSIRSLYFDDYHDSGYSANEAGIEPRSKWRLRIYDSRSEFVRLEQKIKYQGKIRKESAMVHRDFCRRLLEDVNSLEFPAENKVVNRFLLECFTRGLRPRLIVEYEREPYVYDAGDVRITFDKGVRFSGQTECFFEDGLFLSPILRTGEVILEVKYTELLPGILYTMLNTGKFRQSAFSKYYLCRRAAEGGML